LPSNSEEITVSTESSATIQLTYQNEEIGTDTFGDSETIRLTTPAVLQATGRYWASTGDQLGRGSIPPAAGATTKYWIFWSLSETTNSLTDVRFEAELGNHVTLTGRQSVSVGSSISEENGSVVWTITGINPTLSSSNPVVGAAFEVAVTPTSTDIGTTPILINETLLTARDAFTGSFISKTAARITTAIPFDSIASRYGGVVTE